MQKTAYEMLISDWSSDVCSSDLIHPQPGQIVVEIGPGLGALTVPLLEKLGQLQVVEIDRDVIPRLREICDHAPGLTITQGDALSIDYHQFVKDDQRLRLVGNLPYNISTPLLFHLLTQSDAVLDMHFMLQQEVVERMCGTADEDAYGRLSGALAARCAVAHRTEEH